jgi:hypothetical protein
MGRVDAEEVRRLYVDEKWTLAAVAARFACSATTITRALQAAGIPRREGGTGPRYIRRDFSGDLKEMAYLIGFRIGDLHACDLKGCGSRRGFGLGDGLTARGVRCPPAPLRVRAGYVNGYGVVSNQDLWGLGVHRRDSLRLLITNIEPYVRHGRRRRDMLAVLAIV